MEKIKMTEWREVKLGEICDVRDGTHDSPKQALEGKYLVTSKHIKGGRIDLSSAYKISLEDFDFINQRSEVDQWDILISMIGTVGEVCLISNQPDFAIKNVGLIKTGNKDLARYLFYYLKSPVAQNGIESRLKGTTQQYLALSEIRDFPISLPPLEIQRKIAGILGALDDKIEVLRAQNKTLEQMAQAVFQSWFVDFDIVRANAAGLPAADVCKKYHINPDIYDLFPSAFSADNLPLGWEKKSLGELLLLSYGKALKENDRISGSVPVYGSSGQIGMHNESLVKAPGIVVGRKGTVGSVIWCDYDFYPIDTVFYVQFLKETMCWHFTYFLLKNLKLQNLSGDSAVPGLNRDAAYAQTFVCPRTELLSSFEKMADILFCKIKSNTEQIRTLEQIRDTLLPQLISGKIDVENVSLPSVNDEDILKI